MTNLHTSIEYSSMKLILNERWQVQRESIISFQVEILVYLLEFFQNGSISARTVV